jgi:hypothetical protein
MQAILLVKIKNFFMARNSEKTFGSRIANAEAIATHLKSFTTFVAPTTSTTIENYDGIIATLKTENAKATNQRVDYSLAVSKRANLFFKEKGSVEKLLSPITSTVRASFGKTSPEAIEISNLATKIRGEKKKKEDKLASSETKETDKKIKSSSLRSYGSITQHFADMLVTLTNFGTSYSPANNEVKLVALNAKISLLRTANNEVTEKMGSYKSTLNTRLGFYKDLSERTQRIKEAVKSQYGASSTEYGLIKKLVV